MADKDKHDAGATASGGKLFAENDDAFFAQHPEHTSDWAAPPPPSLLLIQSWRQQRLITDDDIRFPVPFRRGVDHGRRVCRGNETLRVKARLIVLLSNPGAEVVSIPKLGSRL
jgi:hypothetical protein